MYLEWRTSLVEVSTLQIGMLLVNQDSYSCGHSPSLTPNILFHLITASALVFSWRWVIVTPPPSLTISSHSWSLLLKNRMVLRHILLHMVRILHQICILICLQEQILKARWKRDGDGRRRKFHGKSQIFGYTPIWKYWELYLGFVSRTRDF